MSVWVTCGGGHGTHTGRVTQHGFGRFLAALIRYGFGTVLAASLSLSVEAQCPSVFGDCLGRVSHVHAGERTEQADYQTQRICLQMAWASVWGQICALLRPTTPLNQFSTLITNQGCALLVEVALKPCAAPKNKGAR